MRLASCKYALNPSVVYSTGRSKAMVLVLVLLFVTLWFILRGDLFYALPPYLVLFCSNVFRPFSIAITSLGEERANLSVFRMLIRLASVWFCLLPLPLVALPGLFSYLFVTSTR